MGSSPRSYGQACPLALSMDLLGERWTLLVVRELLLGPKRFTELASRLDAAGPNRLSQRLRTLQHSGVVVKTADGRYMLSPFGEGLRGPVIGLAIWGLGLMTGSMDMEKSRSDIVALCMTAIVEPDLLTGLDLDCEVDVGDIFTISAHDGDMSVRSGTSSAPSPIRLRCAASTFLALSAGLLDLSDAGSAGDIHVDGSLETVRRLFAAFAVTYRDYIVAS